MIARILSCFALLSSFAFGQQASPVIIWQNPASVPFGTPLSPVQLNAVATSTPIVPVDLSTSYNVTGITTAGTAFAEGFDDGNAAYPDSVLHGSVNWRGIPFAIGPVNAPDAVTEATIPLPATGGHSAQLLMLANAVNNPSPATQTFIVHYTDGTSAPIQVTLSDWSTPMNYDDESTVVCSAYRYSTTGAQNPVSVCLREYSLPLDVTKVASSLEMPPIRDIVLVSLAMERPLVAGTFSYSYSPGIVLPVGSYVITATFTPNDPASFTSANATVPYTVLADSPQIPATITWPMPQPINYGTALSSTQLNATASNYPGSVQVPLADDYRIEAIIGDGAVSYSNGLNGSGAAFSDKALGPAVFYRGTDYMLGGIGQPSAVTSTSITLPAGNYQNLYFLGVAIKAAQLNQPFTVTYTDGTTTTGNVSLSSWSSPQNLAGETIARAMTVINNYNGVQTQGTADLYGYQLTLNATKTVASLTLPTNPNVMVLAVGLGNGGPSATPGSFIYNPVSGTILPPGLDALSTTFTPVDTVNFATLTIPNQIQVNGPATDFTLTATPTVLNIAPGGTGHLNVHVSPLLGNYPGTVVFSLEGALPPHTVVSFSPSTIGATAGAADSTMVLDLSQVASNTDESKPFVSTGGKISFCVGLFLLLPWAAIRRFRRGSSFGRMTGTLAGVVALFALLAGSTGCTLLYRGASYNLVLRATSGTISHTVPVTLHIVLPN